MWNGEPFQFDGFSVLADDSSFIGRLDAVGAVLVSRQASTQVVPREEIGYLINVAVIVQAVVPVYEDDTEETLAARILKEEHRIYSEAIRRFFEGGLRISGRRVIRRA